MNINQLIEAAMVNRRAFMDMMKGIYGKLAFTVNYKPDLLAIPELFPP